MSPRWIFAKLSSDIIMQSTFAVWVVLNRNKKRAESKTNKSKEKGC